MSNLVSDASLDSREIMSGMILFEISSGPTHDRVTWWVLNSPGLAPAKRLIVQPSPIQLCVWLEENMRLQLFFYSEQSIPVSSRALNKSLVSAILVMSSQ